MVWLVYINHEKIGKTFILQKGILKMETNHGEIKERNWKDKRNEWLPYVKKKILYCFFIC